jgi:hypothetical protein
MARVKNLLGDGPAILHAAVSSIVAAGTPEEKRRTRNIALVGVFLGVVLFCIGMSLYSHAQSSERAIVIHRVAFCLAHKTSGNCQSLLKIIGAH